MAGEAEVKDLDGDFRIILRGAFVRRAVTCTPIPLEEAERLERRPAGGHAMPDAVMRRLHPNRK